MRVPALGTIVASLIVGGCVTTSGMQVGAAREMLTGFREVVMILAAVAFSPCE
jgi:hypothetical protein